MFSFVSGQMGPHGVQEYQPSDPSAKFSYDQPLEQQTTAAVTAQHTSEGANPPDSDYMYRSAWDFSQLRSQAEMAQPPALPSKTYDYGSAWDFSQLKSQLQVGTAQPPALPPKTSTLPSKSLQPLQTPLPPKTCTLPLRIQPSGSWFVIDATVPLQDQRCVLTDSSN